MATHSSCKTSKCMQSADTLTYAWRGALGFCATFPRRPVLELVSWRQRPEVKVSIRAHSQSIRVSLPDLPFGEKLCKTFCRIYTDLPHLQGNLCRLD